MKITKNMYVTNTAESRELELYMENTRDIYFRCLIPAINNLKKKMARGIFDKEKATILFYHVATRASEAYNRDFGYKFTVTERWTAASNVLEHWLDDIMEELGVDTIEVYARNGMPIVFLETDIIPF